MAEKITIFELDIDIEASKRDVEDLRSAVNELKKGLKELSDAEKENNKQLDEQQKKLKELQSAKKQDIKSISETQSNIDKLLTKRTELNKSIVDQTSVLKVNQNQLNQSQKVIQDSVTANDRLSLELEEQKIKQQSLTNERKKAIREGIKLANEAKELTRLQNKKNRSDKENIRLETLLVRKKQSLVVKTKEQRKEYKQLEARILKLNTANKKADASIGRFQRNVGNYTNQLRGFAGALGITVGIAGITQLINTSTTAYKEQVIEVAKLTTVLRERTQATDAEIQSVLNLTTVEQQRGIIGDEIQIAGAQQIATFVTQTESVKTLIPALNNLLAQQKGVNATQQDAVTIGNLIGKVLQGETTALKRVGITFNDTQKEILKFGTETEKSAVLAQIITDNVGEMNEKLAETDIGQMKNLENQLGDIEEKIGEQLLPAMVEWKNLQLDILQGIQNIAKGYDVVAFESAKLNVQNFANSQKLNDEETKQNAIRKRFLEIEKEALELQKFFIKNKKEIGDFDNKELKDARDKAAILLEEKKLLIELGKQGFFNGQFKEKEIKANKNIADIEKDLEKQRIKDSKARAKRLKAEEAAKDKALKAEIERKKKEAEAAYAEFERIRDLEKQRKDFIAQSRQELIDQEKDRQIVDEENKLALLETNILGELEAERQRLESRRLQEIEFAEKIGADTYLINEKYKNANEELARAETEAKFSLATEFFDNIATIAGEGTAIGKAAAVASTTISTYQAATGAYAALAGIPVVGPVLGIAAAGAAIAAGFQNVKKILAVDSGLPGDSSVSASVPSASSSSSISRPAGVAPEINQGIISRDTIISNNNEPQVQTAIVVDEVTAKQTEQSSNSTTSVI